MEEMPKYCSSTNDDKEEPGDGEGTKVPNINKMSATFQFASHYYQSNVNNKSLSKQNSFNSYRGAYDSPPQD